MNWKQVALNLAIMGVAYAIGYGSSFFFSKKYAEKQAKEEKDKNEKK